MVKKNVKKFSQKQSQKVVVNINTSSKKKSKKGRTSGKTSGHSVTHGAINKSQIPIGHGQTFHVERKDPSDAGKHDAIKREIESSKAVMKRLLDNDQLRAQTQEATLQNILQLKNDGIGAIQDLYKKVGSKPATVIQLEDDKPKRKYNKQQPNKVEPSEPEPEPKKIIVKPIVIPSSPKKRGRPNKIPGPAIVIQPEPNTADPVIDPNKPPPKPPKPSSKPSIVIQPEPEKMDLTIFKTRPMMRHLINDDDQTTMHELLHQLGKTYSDLPELKSDRAVYLLNLINEHLAKGVDKNNDAEFAGVVEGLLKKHKPKEEVKDDDFIEAVGGGGKLKSHEVQHGSPLSNDDNNNTNQNLQEMLSRPRGRPPGKTPEKTQKELDINKMSFTVMHNIVNNVDQRKMNQLLDQIGYTMDDLPEDMSNRSAFLWEEILALKNKHTPYEEAKGDDVIEAPKLKHHEPQHGTGLTASAGASLYDENPDASDTLFV